MEEPPTQPRSGSPKPPAQLELLPAPALLAVLGHLAALDLARLCLASPSAFGRRQREFGGLCAVEEAARLIRGAQPEAVRERVPELTQDDSTTWLALLHELELLCGPRPFTSAHDDFFDLTREQGAVAVHRGGSGGTAVCGTVAMRAGVHFAEFQLMWRGARVGVCSRRYEPRAGTHGVWATGSSHGWGYDSATGRCFHAAHGTGKRFEGSGGTHTWVGMEKSARGDTIGEPATISLPSGLHSSQDGSDIVVGCRPAAGLPQGPARGLQERQPPWRYVLRDELQTLALADGRLLLVRGALEQRGAGGGDGAAAERGWRRRRRRGPRQW